MSPTLGTGCDFRCQLDESCESQLRLSVRRDLYICPGRKTLKTTGRVHDGKTLYYRARKFDCEACPLKARCCPKSLERRLSRDLDEAARETARALMETEADAASSGERKKIERLFGEAKQILSMIRLRLRGLTGARDELLLTATVQNLKRLANHTIRPPPQAMMA